MPIIRCLGLRNLPRLIQRLHNLLRQRPLLQGVQIRLQLLQAAHTKNNPILAAIFDLQPTVVHEPAQRRLDKRDIVLLRHGLDSAQRGEDRRVEVALAVAPAHGARVVGEAADVGTVGFGGVLAREQTASEGIVCVEGKAVALQRREQLGFHAARDGVIHALVDGWAHPAVVVACQDDLGDFVGDVVADSEGDEFAGLVQLVNGREGLFEGDAAVGGVEVEDVDDVGAELLQGLVDLLR